MRTPKKLASSMNAVKVSYDSSGPWIGPDSFDSTLQFVPNSKAITTPDTTPRPKATPKILSQNSKSAWYTGRPVRRCSASRTVSQAARPIEKAGKIMWNETVKPNCSRERSSAVASIRSILSAHVTKASSRRCTLRRQPGTLGDTTHKQRRLISPCSSDIALDADTTSLRPVAVRISPQVGIARGVGIAPIPPPAPAVMAEAVASGDTNVGPTNVNMSPAATEAAEVTTGEVGTAETSKMTSTSVASASVASAPTSSQGHRRNCCGTTQKGSCQNH